MKAFLKVVGDAEDVNVDLKKSTRTGLARLQSVLAYGPIESVILNCVHRVVQSECIYCALTKDRHIDLLPKR